MHWNRQLTVVGVIVAVSIASTGAWGAATAVLNPTADTILKLGNEANGFANTNYGSEIELVVRNVPSNLKKPEFRSLFQFDGVSTIPAGSTINSATLRIYVNDVALPFTAPPLEIFRVTQSWTEFEATWNQSDASHPWSGGGAFTGVGGSSTPYFSFDNSDGSLVNGSYTSWNLTQLAQEWYQGTNPNYGMILLAPNFDTLIGFGSREMTLSTGVPVGNPVDMPELIIDYTPPSIPGDVNMDGFVDIFDVNEVSAHWGETGPAGDANGDMMVDIFDVNLISANWAPAPPPGGGAAAVPEPTALALLTVALAGFCTTVWSKNNASRLQLAFGSFAPLCRRNE